MASQTGPKIEPKTRQVFELEATTSFPLLVPSWWVGKPSFLVAVFGPQSRTRNQMYAWTVDMLRWSRMFQTDQLLARNQAPYTRVFIAFGGARTLGIRSTRIRSTPAPEPSRTRRNQARNQAPMYCYIREHKVSCHSQCKN